MKKHYNIAIEAAVKAGEKIMSVYTNSDFEVELKEDDSPLTIADKKSNDVINKYLQKSDFPIISEENKQLNYEERKHWKQCWMVDPLDGTKEFIKRNGEFTVNIAFIENQKPIFGVIYVPVTKELYVGKVESNKSYKVIIDENTTDVSSIPFSNKDEIQPTSTKNEIRVVGSRSHMNDQTLQFIDSLKEKSEKEVAMVSKGSSLKFCLVAEGKADFYPRFAPTMEWDTAAGQAICEAVGLQVIAQDSQEGMRYNKENLLNPWFKVSECRKI
jgi:3'(2'), 5'-bisphosphate nucleotidase